MRVAYLWTSGEITSNLYLSSFYSSDRAAVLEHHSNTGDLFVTEASLLLTRPEVVCAFDPASPTPKSLEKLHAGFDVIFIRGANTLGDEKWAQVLAAYLEQVSLPVVCLGIGIQAPSLEQLPKSSGVERLAKILGERSKMVGVRGQITADFLESRGVHNVQVVGCPSILRHNSDSLRVEKPEWQAVKSCGFSLTRYHGVLYQRDPLTFLKVQSRLIKELSALFRLGIITQVEREEKAVAYRDPNAMESALDRLRDSGWLDAEMEEIYRNRSIFFGTRPIDYDLHVRNFDVIFGTRLHSNAMAISCGVPAITLTYDLRVQEIYDFWQLPYLSVEKAMSLTPRQIFELADFDSFNNHIPFVYSNFRDYLETNGITHVMKPAQG